MSIVVTGGAGFIGRQLVARLCAIRGAFGCEHEPVVVLDNLHRGSREALAPLIGTGDVRFVEGDVRDATLLADVMQGAEYIFHLAAQSNVLGAESDPDYAFTTNVVGTYAVLQAAIAASARRLVFTSSREVYGQPAELPAAEHDPLTPKNAYGASKAAGEMACRAAAARGGLEITVLRLANVYGSGDTGRVIPLWLERAARGEDLLVYGGTQVLDFIWVGDTVSAMVRAALAPRVIFAAAGLLPIESEDRGFFIPINIGSGRPTPIYTLAEKVRDAVGRRVEIRNLPARSAEVERFVADVSLMRTVLGLRPEPPLTHLSTLAREARLASGARDPETTATPASSGARPRLKLLAHEG